MTTKKFSLDQYGILMEIKEKYFPNSTFSLGANTKPLDLVIRDYNKDLYKFILDNNLEEATVALMSTASRMLVYPLYVDDGLRYWRLNSDTSYWINDHNGATAPLLSKRGLSLHTEEDITHFGYSTDLFTAFDEEAKDKAIRERAKQLLGEDL